LQSPLSLISSAPALDNNASHRRASAEKVIIFAFVSESSATTTFAATQQEMSGVMLWCGHNEVSPPNSAPPLSNVARYASLPFLSQPGSSAVQKGAGIGLYLSRYSSPSDSSRCLHCQPRRRHAVVSPHVTPFEQLARVKPATAPAGMVRLRCQTQEERR